MHPDIQEKLLALNREFYQTFAADFADSRSRPQPGVAELIDPVESNQSVLDLGCGNGSLADALYDRGHRGQYVGMDSSPALLAWAREHCRHTKAAFVQADFAQPDWPEPLPAPQFPWIFALAVLHHLPGSQLRLKWVSQLKPLLTHDGRLVISVWNFPAERRWRQRVLPWSTLGLDTAELEPGDALLDWRRGGTGLRYVHHFQRGELAELAAAAGFRVETQLEAGGESGHLNRLQLWQPL